MKAFVCRLLILLVGLLFASNALAALKVDNQGDLSQAQATIFKSGTTSGWVLLSYVGPSTVHFSGSGKGGVAELSGNLKDDQIQYALLRVNSKTKGVRDVFIRWTGPSVGISEKGKKDSFMSDAQSVLQPFQSQFDVTARDKLTQALAGL